MNQQNQEPDVVMDCGEDDEADYEYGDDEDLEDDADEQDYVQIPTPVPNIAGGSLKISIPLFSSAAKVPEKVMPTQNN